MYGLCLTQMYILFVCLFVCLFLVTTIISRSKYSSQDFVTQSKWKGLYNRNKNNNNNKKKHANRSGCVEEMTKKR